MTSQTRLLAVTIVAGVALLAGIWFAAIAPKRSEHAKVANNVASQQLRLDRANTQLAGYKASRKQFAGLLTELRRLDKAVPSSGAVSSMLRQLQRRARARGSDLRLVALKDGGGAAAAAATAPAAPGAVPGPGGLSALPFTFEYTGKYFDLLQILATVRTSVRLKGGDLTIGGRLLTIDGLSFQRLDDDTKLTKAVVNATAYIAPDGAGAPQPPTAAQVQVAKGGS